MARRGWASAAAAVLATLLLALEVFAIAPGLADDAIADGLSDVEGGSEAIASGALTIGTSPGIGFWIAILVLLGLAAWQAHVAYHGKAQAEHPEGSPEAGRPSQGVPWSPPAGGPQSGGTPLA